MIDYNDWTREELIAEIKALNKVVHEILTMEGFETLNKEVIFPFNTYEEYLDNFFNGTTILWTKSKL